MKERLKNMPIPVVATMLGAATLSNIYQGLGYDWIRHLTMWAATAVLRASLVARSKKEVTT